MYRREEEFLRHEGRANYLDERAMYEAARGDIRGAVIDEIRADINRAEGARDLVNPYPPHHHHHGGRLEGGIIAAEVIAAENAVERERIREMELARGAYGVAPGGVGPYYPPVGAGYGAATTEVIMTNTYPNAYPQPYPPAGTGYPGYQGYPGAPGYPPY